MKWVTALFLGAILGFILPLFMGGADGVWMESIMRWGTVRPFPHSPGLLFSIPVAVAAAFVFRLFFNWHSN
jgi:hypothetical protein